MKPHLKIILKYLLIATGIGALLYFGILRGDPTALRIETSGL